ncbi:hypothetical protein HDU79_007032 [Rhizoclosmatium sp. JEL0117]|nr:hypothetical protein HDU79_007032 [Rhizoclosmatium sp. JEL0117]
MEAEEERLFGDSNAAFAVARLAASLVSTPVELVATLRTVEFCPTKDFLFAASSMASSSSSKETANDSEEEEEEEEEEQDEHEQDNDDDFSDGDTEVAPDAFDFQSTNQKPNAFTDSDLESLNDATTLLKNTDSMGYLIRSGLNDDDQDPTRPPFEISVQGLSTFQAISKVVKCESEGVWSLWNGLFISWFHEMTHLLLIQPSIEQSLNDAFDIRDDTIPTLYLDSPIPTLATLIGSHALSGILLSPMELVRTRILVQTSSPYHRKYTSSLTALPQIIREEGFGSLYWSRRLPATILLKTLQPLFKYGSPLFIQRIIGVDPEMQPVLYQMTELAMNLIELFIVMPVETVVRRLECQVVGRFVAGDVSEGEEDGDERNRLSVRGKGGPFQGMVRVNAIPYTGFWNCISRVIREEGYNGMGAVAKEDESGGKGRRRRSESKGGKSSNGEKKKKRSKAGGWFSPLGGLYRGLKLRMYVNVTVAVLRALSSD